MKYCLSIRQDKEYLQKADEFFVPWKDREKILDLIEINPKASYVLSIDNNNLTDKDWAAVEQYYIITKKNLKVCLTNLNYDECKKREIPFFFSTAITDAYVLNAFIEMGICAARITGQLAHQLGYLNTLPIEIRVWPNKSCAPFGYSPMVGGWFRPEDLVNIEAIDVCEFDTETKKEESALFRIYAEDKEWSGSLHLLIKDIEDETIVNRLIPPGFQARRSNCGMRCQSGGQCHFCYGITYFANPEVMKNLKEKYYD